MRAVRQFNVVPAIPPRLAALSDLANNIHWTWDRLTQALFSRLDPQLWESGGHDPLRLIAGITESRWSELPSERLTASTTCPPGSQPAAKGETETSSVAHEGGRFQRRTTAMPCAETTASTGACRS